MWDLELHFARVTDMIAEANYSFTWSFFQTKKNYYIFLVLWGGHLEQASKQTQQFWSPENWYIQLNAHNLVSLQ